MEGSVGYCPPLLLLLLAAAFTPGHCLTAGALEDHRANLCLPLISDPNTTTTTTTTTIQSACALVRPEMTQPVTPATILTFSYPHISMAAGLDNHLMLWVEDEHTRYYFNHSLEAELWNPLCFGMQNQAEEVWASLGGNFLSPTKNESISGMATPMEGKPLLCLGHSMYGLHNSFTGMVALVSVFNDTPTYPDCKYVGDEHNALDMKDVNWEGKGPESMIEVEENPCSQSYQDLLIKQLLNHYDFFRLCRSLGGRLPYLKEVLMNEVGIQPQTCDMMGKNVWWMGGMNMTGKGVMTKCPVLLTNMTMGWRPCLSELNCSLCRVPTTLTYTVYGELMKYDRKYSLKLLQGGGFFLEGDETSKIIREGEDWVLQSNLHQEKMWLPKRSWPMGRHLWHSIKHNTTLTLSSCNNLQFSSDDAVCLLRSQRCNSIKESNDDSDERDCRKRLIQKEANYNILMGPYHGNDKKGYLKFKVEIKSIDKMTTEEGTAEIELDLVLQWNDPRIKFVDTKMSTNLFPCEEIWKPNMGIVAGYERGEEVDKKEFFSRCHVSWNKKLFEEEDRDDPLMGMFIPPGNINITLRKYIRFAVPCELRVHRYPFGSYKCNASFYLVEAFREMVWTPYEDKSGYYSLNYTGNKDLLDYRLKDVTMDFHGRLVTLALHLNGQYEYHLLNSFCPSALVYIISHSTFSFPITDFNERIMVSLTSMLVLAGLFSQASGTYIKTPYYKLLDIWYANLILSCFLVVIANTIVNSVRMRAIRTQVVPLDSDQKRRNPVVAAHNKKAEKCNRAFKVILSIYFSLHIFLFILFSTDIL